MATLRKLFFKDNCQNKSTLNQHVVLTCKMSAFGRVVCCCYTTIKSESKLKMYLHILVEIRCNSFASTNNEP